MKALALGMAIGMCLLFGCHEEPSIVIKFEPNDLAGSVTASVKIDAGTAQKVVPPADAGATKPTATGAACKVAADCVAIKADCCDCNNGGAQKVVGKGEVAKLDKELKARCKGTMCATMMSNDPSCGKKADCVAGHCALH